MTAQSSIGSTLSGSPWPGRHSGKGRWNDDHREKGIFEKQNLERADQGTEICQQGQDLFQTTIWIVLTVLYIASLASFYQTSMDLFMLGSTAECAYTQLQLKGLQCGLHAGHRVGQSA